ncbi:MAG TPA: type IV pilus modification protein PilV [Gammaproteobacteria bacterium]
MNHRNSQNGFSLIEILVALFVFAIGILSVAGLQIVSKRTNFEAVQRTSATFLAYDILERMRANPRELGSYVDVTLGATRPAPAVMCDASACTAEELAAFDVWEWQRAIQGVAEQSAGTSTGGLVNPTGCIAGPAAGGQGTYTITIAWQGVDALTNEFDDNLCGNGNAGYGETLEYRRLIVITTYIAP